MSSWEERYPRLWAFAEKVSVLVIGGLLFYLFSAVIITVPAALVGLFATVAALIRPVGGESVSRFWRGFRRTFGRALLLGLIELVSLTAVWFYYGLLWNTNTVPGRMAAYLMAVVGLMIGLAHTFAWPMLTWYPQPLGKLLKRSVLLAAAHPFHALGGLASAAGVLVLFYVLPGQVKSLAVLLGPGLYALGTGASAWKAMKRYAGPDDEFAE